MDVGIRSRIKIFKWTRGGNVFLQLFESRKKALFVTNLGGSIVIGMTAGPVGKDHDTGPEPADDARQGHSGGNIVFQARVGPAEILAPGKPEMFSRNLRFSNTQVRCTTCAHVTRGEIEHARTITEFA